MLGFNRDRWMEGSIRIIIIRIIEYSFGGIDSWINDVRVIIEGELGFRSNRKEHQRERRNRRIE